MTNDEFTEFLWRAGNKRAAEDFIERLEQDAKEFEERIEADAANATDTARVAGATLPLPADIEIKVAEAVREIEKWTEQARHALKDF